VNEISNKKENRAGLYLTIIFHLVVIIVLLVYQIDSTMKAETSFVLDFSKQEELEKQEEIRVLKEEVSKQLDEMIAAARASQAPIRNIAVDASNKPLKDDRNTDVDQLYKDAERLAKELKANQNAIEEDATEETVDMSSKKSEENEQTSQPYSGASVLSYRLDGRKARHLPIPAYKCYGGGDVVVIINVDQAGCVVGAKVNEAGTTGDGCMKREAVKAAKLSRFSGSQTAPDPQVGEIVYRFIPQQ
jgi:outer membrane biosynthesis protein TonB